MVKVFDTCLDETLQHLSFVEKYPCLSYDLPRYKNIKKFQAELRLYRMLLWCIPDAAVDAHLLADLKFIAASVAQLYIVDAETDSLALTDADEYNLLLRNPTEKLRKCRAEVGKVRYFPHLMSSVSCEAGEPSCFTTNNDTLVEFLDSLESLQAVLDDILKDMDKSLVETVFLRDLIYYTSPQTNLNFQSVVHDWANKAACLSLLQGLVEIDKYTSRRLLIDLQQIVNPCNPDFIKLCFEVIKAPKMKHVDRLLFGEFVSRFVDFFLDNLLFVLNDDFPMVREGLIFVLTFLADPPTNILDHTDLMPCVQEQIYAVLDQASYIMCFFSEANIDLSRGKMILDTFLKSIDEVRGDIVNLYVHIPPLPWSDFPRINRLGFFECLLAYLENLKDTMNNNRKLVPFLKHQIITIHQELLPLRSFLQKTWVMQNELIELKDISEQIMSLLCQSDFAIKSSFFIDNAIWYNLTFLSFLVRKIKDIRFEVKNIEIETQTEGSHICKPLTSSMDVHKPSTSTPAVEVVVGFEKETEILIDRLIGGSKQLDIVSIVGMGGIGKTTLAKKLYNEPSIKHHFHKRAFCSVSQVYRKRKVLLDIWSGLSLNGDEIHQMDDDKLAHRLRQSLLGSRYLIVVDDIWDVDVWYDISASFPDDRKGSRVIFTTRINIVSLTAKPDSAPCQLQFLSIDKSWELLQQKVFHRDPCPPHLLEVGKMIARNCKGLPLSIVVIAGLLKRTERSLVYWKEVAETLSSFASSEGCYEIIKLSYKQLPDAVKSCFLYLGVIPENETLKAGQLALLWVAEGFVLKSEGDSLLKIAEKYLNDLGDRNLVTVNERKYNGGIHVFCVHDLIRDFCRTEAQEENHLHYINSNNKNFPMSHVLHQHRISIEGEWRSFVNAKPRGSTVHSLLVLASARSSEICEVNSLQSFLSNFKLVTVLNLMAIVIDGEFPKTVTTLVHLRYLALRFSAKLDVPSDIINLWNLEFFRLTACEYAELNFSTNSGLPENRGTLLQYNRLDLYKVTLPKDIWEMKRLRDVVLAASAIVALDNVTRAPLPDLMSFGFVDIPCGEEGDELLRRLSNVRKFKCHCSGLWDPDRECNVLPKLETFTKLESLYMILTGEARPPYVFSFPSTLRKLNLGRFDVPWNEFSAIIGMLPCLEVLVLQSNAFSGKIWNAEDTEFPKIKFLILMDLDVEEWNATVHSFPCLVKLMVLGCRKLIAIPRCFGEVGTLMSIEVDACKQSLEDSAIQIQEDQSDYGNEGFEVKLRKFQRLVNEDKFVVYLK